MVIVGKRFQSHLPVLRDLCVEIPVPTFCTASKKSTPLSLLPATLTSQPQLMENGTTLSPVFATLTKNMGVGVAIVGQRRSLPSFSWAVSLRILQSSLCARTATPATPIVSYVYFTVLWIPGGGSSSSFLVSFRPPAGCVEHLAAFPAPETWPQHPTVTVVSPLSGMPW
jgi:hypothetical protein